MPIRVHVREGETTWEASIVGGSVTLKGSPDPLKLRDGGDGHWRVSRSGQSFDACAASQGDTIWVSLDGELFEMRIDPVDGTRHVQSRGREGLSAPMPATVVRIATAPGTRVSRGDPLIVLEAMKMELSIRAPQDGVIKAVYCEEGQLVQPGVVLVDLV